MAKWQKKYRYREVTRVCLPLVLGMSATTVMEFTDRAFLSNYSINAISAAAPAGITAFLFMAFFGGVGGYAGVFIAQYSGRGANDRIGKVLWQGIYFSIFSGFVFWLLALFATGPIFALAGHSAPVRELEEIYFSILCKGAILHVAVYTLATFFTGRGITRPVMLITLTGMAVNIPLDYALIYGRWGMPEMGITGAAIATVAAWGINFVLLLRLIFTKTNNHRFGVFTNRRFDKKLFLRLLRFGIPGSLQFSLDILAFTIFILLVGRIGKIELATTNIVLSINSLAFMPSMGVSQGVSILVGQALGKGKPLEAKLAVWSSVHLLLAYICIIDLIFIFFPELVLTPFLQAGQDPDSAQAMMTTGVVLLQIISAYLFMDSLYMIFSGALKGAGDTRFLMLSVGACSLCFFILPVYLGIEYFHMSITTAWYCVLLFVAILFLLSAGRYRTGRWQQMLVIERKDDLAR